MADQPQTWEVALDVDGSHRVERVTIMPPFGIRCGDDAAIERAAERVEITAGSPACSADVGGVLRTLAEVVRKLAGGDRG